METKVSGYAVCAKCGKKYSTLTRHKCFTTTGQPPKKKGKPKDHDLESGPPCESLDKHESEHDGEGEGENQNEGEGQRKGEGDGDGDSEEDADGEGETDREGDGEGDGEGEGEGEGEAPVPQMPEPETPPVAIVCTVLKFAALTAQCAKNGAISVTVEEDGLFVCGHNGDLFAHKTIPWGEFEKRSTLDGEFYVKEIIDAVDEQIGQTAKVDVGAMIEKYKPEPEPEPEPEKPTLTLPLTAGQRVMCRDGKVRAVDSFEGAVAVFSDGKRVFAKTGVCSGGRREGVEAFSHLHNSQDAIADAPPLPKLTLPLTKGQKVVLRNGDIAVVAEQSGEASRLAKFRSPKTNCGWVLNTNGEYCGGGGGHGHDVVADA